MSGTSPSPDTTATKPKPSTPPSAPAVTQQAAAATPLSADAAAVKHFLNEYTTLMGAAIVKPQTIKLGIGLFQRAVKLAITSSDTDARDVLWNYMVSQKTNLMSERMALRGLPNLSERDANQVRTAYTLMRHKVMGDTLPLNEKQATAATSVAFVSYVNKKR